MRFFFFFFWGFFGVSFAQNAPVCGDGIKDSGEECDDGVNNSDTQQNHCRSNCMLPRCGDGTLDASEYCDDGNTLDGDQCPSGCEEPKRKEIPGPPSRIPDPQSELLNPSRGFELAVALTLFGPPGLGITYGPSAGHFYAGEVGRGIATTLLRAGIVGAQIGTQVQFINQTIQPNQFRNRTITLGLALSTLVLIDLLDASEAVRRANEKRKNNQP